MQASIWEGYLLTGRRILSLYPLNEGPNVLSKALLPVGNVPILDHVLDWVLEAGLMGTVILIPHCSYIWTDDFLNT